MCMYLLLCVCMFVYLCVCMCFMLFALLLDIYICIYIFFFFVENFVFCNKEGVSSCFDLAIQKASFHEICINLFVFLTFNHATITSIFVSDVNV